MTYSKYGNKKKWVDGIKFDSYAEAKRYSELKLLQQCGAISELKTHPSYELLPTYKNANDKRIRAIYYVADFSYIDNGDKVIEDVKGVETAVFKIKRKLFEHRYDTVITIIEA